LFYDKINIKEEESSYSINNVNGNYYNLKISIDYIGWIITYNFIGFNIKEEIC
jgi:hypothetical protein